MTRGFVRVIAPVVLAVTLAGLASPPPAQAFDPTKPICTLAGLVSTLAGKVCSTARHAGTVLKAGQKLLGGHVGRAVETLTGAATPVRALTAAAVLAAAGAWVLDGARSVMRKTAGVISATTRPQLQSTWFSSSYWRMAGISALLTLPFLFAAAIQAMIRSDLSLLLHSAFGYLPLGLLAVGIAAPLTQLLLAASDEMSALVSAASGGSSAGLARDALVGAGFSSVSAFPLFFVGLLAVAATLTLWIELLIRAAAVYVIVLMLPLFFAALVWPARRVWAIRAIEMLIALILSKFAIVAVLDLGGAALGHSNLTSVTQMLAGTTLIILAAFSPWALLRLLPLHELASGIEGLRGGGVRGLTQADAGAVQVYENSADFADELADARSERAGAGAAGASAARAAVEGLGLDRSTAGDGRSGPGDGPRDEAAGAPQEGSEPVGAGQPTPPSGAPPKGPSGAPQEAPREWADPLADLLSGERRSAHPGQPRERIPGMDAPWQSDNFSWGTLGLGPESVPEGPIGPPAQDSHPPLPDPDGGAP
jgi:hypothetical protein